MVVVTIDVICEPVRHYIDCYNWYKKSRITSITTNV